MCIQEKRPDLERLAADQVAECLTGLPPGSSLPVNATSDLCDTLELLVPAILRRTHPEWESESIDGFFFSSTEKIDEKAAMLAGTCILISDQAVTPFILNFVLTDAGRLEYLRIRVGEEGSGVLGISGPVCNAKAATELLSGLTARLERVDWVYDVTRS